MNAPTRRGQWGALWNAQELAAQYVQGNQGVVEEVDEMLRSAGHTSEDIWAEAWAARSTEIQRVMQMLAKAEARRNATLKAIERHRVGLGLQLRHAAAQFETAEIQDVQNNMEINQKLAA